MTPPHWKRAQKRTIKFSDLERIEEEKRVRDQEIKRREAERKKRHEEMARDGKKSFFELNQGSSAPPAKESLDASKEEGELDHSRVDVQRKSAPKETEIDLNALDYEAEREENVEEHNAEAKVEIAVASTTVEVRGDKTEHPVEKPEKENRSRAERKERNGKKVESRRNRSRSASKSRSRSRRHSPPGRRDRNVDRKKERESPRRGRRGDVRSQRDRNRRRSRSRDNRRRHSR